MPLALPLLIAFLASALAAGLIRHLALRFNIVDAPDGSRKKQKAPTALLGGVAIYFAFALSIMIVLMKTSALVSGDLHLEQIVGLLFAGAVLIVGGVLDDVRPQRARITVLFPILASIIAIASGLGFAKLTNPFGAFFVIPSTISVCLTFIWLMSMTYTTKLLDGVDGLAASVSLIGASMIAALALSTKFYQPDVALLALLLVFSIFGFLIWNFPPARLYLGEGGSTWLGFTLGALAVIGGSKTATLLLVLGLPALDVAFVTAGRLLAGQPMFAADRSHLHLRLIDAGWSARGVISLYVLTGLIFGLTTLVFRSWEKLLALLVLSTLALCGMIVLKKNKKTS